MQQNDLFVTAVAEYSVGEQSEGNAWGTLVCCVLSADTIDEVLVKKFLGTQEKLYKESMEGVTAMPPAYRSAKSVLLKALRYNVPVVVGVGKSALEAAIKAAMPQEEETPYEAVVRLLEKVAKVYPAMSSTEVVVVESLWKKISTY